MTTLYHGSNIAVTSPSATHGRDNLDFGRAFYLTQHLDQAQRWAEIVATRNGSGAPTVSCYEFDEEAVANAPYRKLIFEEYNKKWLDFVCANRQGQGKWEAYDIIMGGVANDRVISTVEAYIDGLITARQALRQLRFNAPNNQIAIVNQQIINLHLHFLHALPC